MRTLVTCILANFAADLSGWEWVYSLNHVTILCINVGKIDFLGKNLLLGEKYFPWRKFAEGKTPIIGVTFLVKKTPEVLNRKSLTLGLKFPKVGDIIKGQSYLAASLHNGSSLKSACSKT